MGVLPQDLRYAVRTLLRTPGFTIAAIATLALGIATNTAMFSVVNTVLLKPFAYRDPERIVMFQNIFRSGLRTGSAAPVEFNWWRQHTTAVQYISAYAFDVANLTDESFPELIPTMQTSADFFRLCGVNALKGRTFTAEDDLPNAAKTAVLSYSFWQRHFGRDPQVIGRRMSLNGVSYEIIGVVGPELQGGQIAERSTLSGDIEVDRSPDVYIPFQLDPNSLERGHYFNVAGRLKPGVTLAGANTELQADYQEYARRLLDLNPGAGFDIQPLQAAIVSRVRNSLLVLLGAVALVLLIACANAASLLLARASGRKREVAIRAAMGASRGRIIRQLLTESLMLSFTGGVVGLAIGYAAMGALLRFGPDIPRLGLGGSNVNIDWRMLEFTLALSILTGVLSGLAPALQSSRADLGGALKESGSRSGSTSPRHNKTQALLVSAEMAMAVVLLIGASLLVRSFIAIRSVNAGFEAHNVLTMRMSLTGPKFANPADVTQVIHSGLRRVRALSGVEVAGTTCCIPLEDHWQVGFQVAGRPEGDASRGVAGWTFASAGYFETFKIPVLRGRAFTERDETGPPVIIINQTVAKQFWPDSDPLKGQIILGNDPPRQVIGIVRDVRDAFLNRDPRPNLYTPSVSRGGMIAWVIRTRSAPKSLSSTIQNELREASGGLPVGRVHTMEETLSRSTSAEGFNTLVMTIFGCSALVLAAIGIYGLLAYSVAQRVQEIGIRLALGAELSHIRKMVVVKGLGPALAGIVCGLFAALGLTRLLTSFLFRVGKWDPLVFLTVPLILVGVALVAVCVPAMRASRVDPVLALRQE
ncbi:MAG: ABC transporter permease [Bryobacterales bacterium]|nr:ABC transporter permease [Bryobacterales bacterium]